VFQRTSEKKTSKKKKKMAEKAEFLKGLKEWEKSIKVLDNKLKNTNSVPLVRFYSLDSIIILNFCF